MEPINANEVRKDKKKTIIKRSGAVFVFLFLLICFSVSLVFMAPEKNNSTVDNYCSVQRAFEGPDIEDKDDFEHILASRELNLFIKGLKRIKEIKNCSDYSSSVRLDVPMIIQFPELPTGCESVALTILLQNLGEDIDKTLIARDYLIYSDISMDEGFLGDPFSENGAGIYPHGLTETAWGYIHDRQLPYSAIDLRDEPFETLYKIIDKGIPVVVWTTSGYRDFMGYEDGFYLEEHCVVMYGYDLNNKKVYLSDPQLGYSECDLEKFRKIYNEIGKFAMTVFKVEG